MQIVVLTLRAEGNNKRVISRDWTMEPASNCYSSTIISSSSVHLLSSLFILFFVSSYIPLSLALNNRFGEYCLALPTKIINCSEPAAQCYNSSANNYGTCECAKPYYTIQLADVTGRYLKTECLKPRESKEVPCNNSLQCQFEDPYSLCVTETHKRTCKCRVIEGYTLDVDSGRCVRGPPPAVEFPEWVKKLFEIARGIAFIGAPTFISCLALLSCLNDLRKNSKARRTAASQAIEPASEELGVESIPMTQIEPEAGPSCSSAPVTIMSPVCDSPSSQTSSESTSISEQQPHPNPVNDETK